jgi:hypothetical protein
MWFQRPIAGIVLATIVLAAGCVMSRSTAPDTTPSAQVASETLAPSIFYEEGKLLFLGVNVHIARFSLDAELLPVEIAIANKGIEQLSVSPEHITLRSLDGKAWPVASAEESSGSSLRSSFDRQLMPVSFDDVVKLRFPNYKYKPSTFNLRRGNQNMTRTVDMRRNTWTRAQIWFPNPGGELKGKLYEVWLDSPELPEPVFTTVRF